MGARSSSPRQNGCELGCWSAEVLGVRKISLGSLDHALAGSMFTRGIAEARTVLLDLEALLADGRFAA